MIEKKASNDPNEVVVVGFSNKIFEKVEIEPAFPGDETAWKRYSERNLDQSMPSGFYYIAD